MKKGLALALSFVLLLTLFVGCGEKATEEMTTETTSNAEPAKPVADKEPEEATETAEAPSVILLVPGSLGDKSFFDSAFNGLTLIQEAYGCKTKVIEMGTDVAKFAPTMEDVIDEGWDVIVTGGINVSQPLQEIAALYPDQKFILFDEALDYEGGKNPNIYSMYYNMAEGTYLAGAMAAMVTKADMPLSNKENIIGFMGGFDTPHVNDWLVGYIKGAQSIDPSVKVATGYTNSFSDAAKGKEVALALYNAGSDITLHAAGGAGLGLIDAAAEKSAYVIGSDSDQAAIFKDDEDIANSILVSVLKSVDKSIEITIGKHIDGTLEYGSSAAYGVAEGCVVLTLDNQWYNANVPEEIRNQVSDIKAKLEAGEVQVKGAYEMTEDEIKSIKDSAAL